MLIKLLILSVLSAALAEKVRYDNYALYRAYPENEEHLQFFKDLQEESNGLEFWKAPSRVGDYVSVLASPAVKENFEHSMKKRSIASEMTLKNIQEALDAQLFSRRKRNAGARQELFWTNYQTYEDINNWIHHQAQIHDFVSAVAVGRSHEGRNITGIRISRGSGSRRAFVLEGGQIGADLLSPVVLTYIADQLIRGEDPEARAASEEFDWYVIPIVNPDGHEYTQIADRFWLKNRRPITASAVGVDLSRNWNSQWGTRGGSFVPSSNSYVGLGPFSEPETRSVSRFIETLGPNLAGLLSFRGFGQRLLIPFAHSTSPLYNYNQMLVIGRRAMGSLAVRYNTQYMVGTSAAVHDGATGSIADWVKHRFNPPVVATYQLRDLGTWGYTLPVNQVLPSCEETFDSVMAILREARFTNVL